MFAPLSPLYFENQIQKMGVWQEMEKPLGCSILAHLRTS